MITLIACIKMIMNGWCISILKVGQAILTKIQFKNGTFPKYDRPYLITKVSPGGEIDLLIASSVSGKAYKLLFKTNHHLVKYKPPFLKNTFVKLDSLETVDSKTLSYKVLHGGATLDKAEMANILAKIYS